MGTCEVAAAFDVALAKKLSSVRFFAKVQRLAGSPGRVPECGPSGRMGYHWISDAPHGLPGFMLVEKMSDGQWGLQMNPVDVRGVIIVNSFGAFSCDHCEPPINRCERKVVSQFAFRPS